MTTSSTDHLLDEFIPAQGRNVVYGFRNPSYWISGPEGMVKRDDIPESVPAFIYRPAQIVRVWSTNEQKTVNLVVFLDGSNDGHLGLGEALVIWKTSVVIGQPNEAGIIDSPNEHYLPRIPSGASITA